MTLLLAKLALSLLVLGWVAWSFPLGAAIETLAHAAPAWFALAIVLKGAAVLASVGVWHTLLPDAPRWGASVRTYLASLHLGLVGPGNLAGDAYRVAATRQQGLPAALGALLGERALTLAAIAAAAAAGAWLAPDAAPLRWPMTLLALAAAGGVAVGIAAGDRLAARVAGSSWPARTLRGTLEGLARLRAPQAAVAALGSAALVPVLTAGATLAAFLAVGASPGLAFTLAASSAAALVVLLPITVQGIGVREGAFLALFTGLAGIAPELSLAASLLSLAAGLVLGIAAGAAVWFPARAAQGLGRPAGWRDLALLPLLAASALAAQGSPYGSIGQAVERLLSILKGLLGGLSEEMTYLPPGSAPLVMIFGGLFVVAMALVLSMLQPYMGPLQGGRPEGAAAGPAAPAPPRAAVRLQSATATLPPPPTSRVPLPPLPANLVTPQAGAGRSYDDGVAVGKALPLGDIDQVLDAAERMGLGEAHLVAVEPHRLLIRFAGCQTCRLRPAPGQGPQGCEFERGFLEGAMRGIAPRTVVAEASCSRAADGACEFEVSTGG